MTDELNTPLHLAARGRHVDAIRILCDRGARVDLRNQLGYLAIDYVNAYEYGTAYQEVFSVLHEAMERQKARRK